MDFINLLTSRHNEWVRMACSLGAGDFKEDIVQEMYIRLIKYIDDPKRIMLKDEINTFYVYRTISNMVFDLKREQRKTLIEDVSREELERIPDVTYNDAYDDEIEIILSEIKTWNFYEQKLFKVYYDHNYSIRKISKETTICTSSIFNSLKNGKKRIKKALEEKRPSS